MDLRPPNIMWRVIQGDVAEIIEFEDSVIFGHRMSERLEKHFKDKKDRRFPIDISAIAQIPACEKHKLRSCYASRTLVSPL